MACSAGRVVGDRYLVVATRQAAPLDWTPESVYRLTAGQAILAVPGGTTAQSEAALIDRIRSQTNQLSQPADANDGAGIDWVSTVLPVGGALVGLLAVGLVLMRVWHRIDPS